MIALLWGGPIAAVFGTLFRLSCSSLRLGSARVLRIGLTGGIGCGKTTVANLFAERGAAIVDTDLIAHAMTAPRGPAMAAIARRLRRRFHRRRRRARPRRACARWCSPTPAAKARLEAILHPLIRAEADRQAAAATGLYLIFVVPLLIESGSWRERVDAHAGDRLPGSDAGGARHGAQRPAGSPGARHHGRPGQPRQPGWRRPTTSSTTTATRPPCRRKWNACTPFIWQFPQDMA